MVTLILITITLIVVIGIALPIALGVGLIVADIFIGILPFLAIYWIWKWIRSKRSGGDQV